MVLMHFDQTPAYLYDDPVHLDGMLTTQEESRAAARALGSRVEMLGGYQLTIIEKRDN